jgi:NADH dehydrogenase
MSKIVIFGGNGYIGRAFVRRLLQSSSVAGPFSVVLASRSGLVTQQFPERETIKVSTAKAEVSDYKTVSDLCSGASTVINLVGLLEETPSNQFKQVQLDGAVNVAKAAKLSGSNLLHLSAIGADENSDIPYAKTKALAEAEITKLFSDAKDQFAVMLRPSLVLGEEDQFLNVHSKVLFLML